jgi:uncharacterized protein
MPVVESTDGSSHNINAIRAGELDMGIAQSDVQAAAYNGTEGFVGKKPFKELRSIFSVYAEPLHFLTRADAGINTFMDVKGKRVNIGNAGSGQRQTVELILAHLGWDKSVFSLAAEFQSAEQSQALCDNRIDAVFFTVGVPNGSIKEAARTCNTKIIPLAGDWVDTFLRKFPAYTKATIPGGIYRGTNLDVATIESRATLISSTKAGNDAVYEVVKAVFENLEDFKNMHPAFAHLNKLEMIRNGLTAPLHEGAVRYYQETGLM